jgi:hypothetical protein
MEFLRYNYKKTLQKIVNIKYLSLVQLNINHDGSSLLISMISVVTTQIFTMQCLVRLTTIMYGRRCDCCFGRDS